jgi:undecaprenyl-diphosphatase
MLPGISRSGSTIATGLYLGLNREFAAAFSFLLSIPSILGASLVEALSGEAAEVSPGLLFYGFVLALLVGYGALRLLLTTLKQSRIHLFSFYCFAAALFLLLIQLSNG